MVSTRSSITPSGASTFRSANGGTADGSSSTPSEGGATVDAAANGPSEPAYSPTGLSSLSDELLEHIWELALADAYQTWPFSTILVNRRMCRAAIPAWYRRCDLHQAIATFDSDVAALFRHSHEREHVRYLAVNLECREPPVRSIFAGLSHLLQLRTLVLQGNGDPTPCPFDEYLRDISGISTLQELILNVEIDTPIARPPPSFPALRRLRSDSGHLATWILQGSNPALGALDLSVADEHSVPCIPWRTLRYLYLALPLPRVLQARALLKGLKSYDENDELAAAGLRGMSIRLGNSYASEGLEEARTVHQELLGSLSKTGIGRLRIYEPAGEDWACAASASPAPSITSLWFSCSRGDPDTERWTRLARLLPLFPSLRRLELNDFKFCYLSVTPADDVSSLLHLQQLAVQHPTLAAILLYFKHTQVLQLRLSYSGGMKQLWATRSSTREDFTLERWTVEKAEQNLDEYW